jgi:hypothetical protein
MSHVHVSLPRAGTLATRDAEDHFAGPCQMRASQRPQGPHPQNDYLHGFAFLLAGLPVHVRESAHANSSNSALASWRSAVSKPSVNQL